MGNKPLPHQSYLFSVRLWRETLSPGQIEWRGQAEFVESGASCAFRDWPALERFLGECLAQGGRPLDDNLSIPFTDPLVPQE